MKILLTGSTGLIGNKLAHELVANGDIVHALCRNTADLSNLNHPNIKIFFGDVTDLNTVKQAMNDCQKVYHLAAYARGYAKDKNLYYRINVGGTENVCKAALELGIEKIVVTSTIVTFGPTGKTPQDETTKRDESQFYTTYEHSKFLAEKSVEQFNKSGLNAVIVHPTRIFGPGLMNESNSVTIMIKMYLDGKMRTILGNGNGIGNYGFVDDVVRGHMLAMKYGIVGEKYILGGENVTYNEFFRSISEITGQKYFQLKIPYPVALTFAAIEEMRAKIFNSYPLITPEWVRTFKLDWSYTCQKAEKELGYKYTPFKDAMRITIEWLKNYKGKLN